MLCSRTELNVWWGWMIFGAVMLGSELLIVDAAFYLVFIGSAAVITGLVGLAGLELALWAQWLLFAALSIITMVFFRKRMYQTLRGTTTDYDSGPAGEVLRLEEALEPGDSCRMTYRGTTWTVLNSGSGVIEKGKDVRISRVDGLTLIIDHAK